MNQEVNLQQSWNDSADRILELFKSLQKQFREQLFEKYKQCGYTGPQLEVVFALHKKPYLTLHELSDYLGLSKSTVSGIVDRLVEHGTVVREVPKDNRRIVRLSLSEEFLVGNDLIALKDNYFHSLLKDAEPEDISKIIVGLEKLCELVGKRKMK